jgi:hypothetical protein
MDVSQNASSLGEWLDRLRPGWAARFVPAFERSRITDLGGLQDADFDLLEDELQKCGAKLVHVRQIRKSLECVAKPDETVATPSLFCNVFESPMAVYFGDSQPDLSTLLEESPTNNAGDVDAILPCILTRSTRSRCVTWHGGMGKSPMCKSPPTSFFDKPLSETFFDGDRAKGNVAQESGLPCKSPMAAFFDGDNNLCDFFMSPSVDDSLSPMLTESCSFLSHDDPSTVSTGLYQQADEMGIGFFSSPLGPETRWVNTVSPCASLGSTLSTHGEHIANFNPPPMSPESQWVNTMSPCTSLGSESQLVNTMSPCTSLGSTVATPSCTLTPAPVPPGMVPPYSSLDGFSAVSPPSSKASPLVPPGVLHRRQTHKCVSFADEAHDKAALQLVDLIDLPPTSPESSIHQRVWQLSQDPQGTFEVQRAIDACSNNEQRVAMVSELRGHILEAVKCPHANHVVRKAITSLPSRALDFIVLELLGHGKAAIIEIAEHRYGCRIIEGLLTYCSAEQLGCMVEYLLAEAMPLCTHMYGNFVMQALIERPGLDTAGRLRQGIQANVLILGTNFYGSAVMKKSLQCSDAEERHRLVIAILSVQGLLAALGRYRHGKETTKLILSMCQGPEIEVARMQLSAPPLKIGQARKS